MKKLGGGRIIFVASQVAQAAMHGYTAYAASKWALRGTNMLKKFN
jgi:NAD(P)-dependent dehydrogenase (short-subunit alcohol dehydrogenase family)